MSKEAKEKFLRVTDSSCTSDAPVRQHTINVRGEEILVTFELGKETILPFEQGVKFMVDGFKVEEVDGFELHLPTVAKDSVTAQLAKDECVAKFSELTLTALTLRAAQKPGGEIYLNATEEEKADVVAFMIGEPPAGAIDAEENLIEDEESDDDVSGLIGSSIQPSTFTLRDGTILSLGDIVRAAVENSGLTNKKWNEADQDTREHFISEVVAGLDLQEPAEDTAAGESNTEQTFTQDEINRSTDEALNLAVQYGVDIKSVPGTGANGNVLKGDVEDFIAANNLKPVDPVAGA